MKCMSLLRLMETRSIKCMRLLGDQSMSCMDQLCSLAIELSGHIHRGSLGSERCLGCVLAMESGHIISVRLMSPLWMSSMF